MTLEAQFNGTRRNRREWKSTALDTHRTKRIACEEEPAGRGGGSSFESQRDYRTPVADSPNCRGMRPPQRLTVVCATEASSATALDFVSDTSTLYT